MISSLQSLIESLKEGHLDQHFGSKIMQDICFGVDEISQYIHFNDRFYTRNLITRTDDFELLALCWKSEQKTPVHDHNGAKGWIKVLQGQIEETRYKQDLSPKNKCLKLHFQEKVSSGDISYIEDEIGLHSLANVSSKNCITLHLYSPSVVYCNDYDQKTSQAKKHVLVYQ